MNEILEKLKLAYAELERLVADNAKRSNDLTLRESLVNEKERDAEKLASECTIKERELHSIKVTADQVAEAQKQLKEARVFYSQARELMDKAEAYKADLDRQAKDLSNMKLLYAEKDRNLERRASELESRKANLRAEIFEEMRQKLV